MFGALGRVASRRPWFIIAGWVVFAGLVISLAPTLEATTDQSEFLPSDYESIQAAELQAEAFPDTNSTVGAIVVFDRADGSPLSAEDLGTANQVMSQVGADLGQALDRVQPIDPSNPDVLVTPSQNQQIGFSIIGLAEGATGYAPEEFESVTDLRADLGAALDGTDLEAGVTGALAQGYDSQEASGNALAIVGAATILLIVVLLALIFRSVIITLMPIVIVGVVSSIATGLIAWANDVFDLKASSDVEVILLVVLYGIGTDYILFFLFRYRERLREGEDTRSAVAHALERAGEAIASAGGAVIVAFMALILSSLGIFRSIGPALAIAVAVTLLAALTLVPAVVTLLGKALFWPSKKYLVEPTGARFAAIGAALGRHPGRFAIASGGVLTILAVIAFSFSPTFDLGDSGLPDDVESVVATDKFTENVSAGASDPGYIMLTSEAQISRDDAAAFAEQVAGARGVASAQPAQASADGTTWQITFLLDENPSSDAAIKDVEGPVRDAAAAAAPSGTQAFVGGTTSIFVDFQQAMSRDYSVVFPVAALVIMVILALLLRSLVAPIYLMVSVGLGFAATLGMTTLVFQHIGGADGLIFLLPIYIYLFVVALGTDYNILMVARLREESREGKSPHDAAALAVRHAGPTIAAAGVILAGTFASLMLGGNSLLVSMGFALSFGILVAAFVMSMFFTPAITALLGHKAWWPGSGDEKRADEPELADA
ncbi:MAG: MMPL family transporter [Nocardioides sp.]|uniref:MMPL family transporter n=1 Tax=Nocardioides sp. TaxID=35761 RepID=UPI0023919844|nr:MMPL family transporter [Nocardioides sp.]MDE0775594.1 MMPL family transporter [Nocardioides sp.]